MLNLGLFYGKTLRTSPWLHTTFTWSNLNYTAIQKTQCGFSYNNGAQRKKGYRIMHANALQ